MEVKYDGAVLLCILCIVIIMCVYRLCPSVSHQPVFQSGNSGKTSNLTGPASYLYRSMKSIETSRLKVENQEELNGIRIVYIYRNAKSLCFLVDMCNCLYHLQVWFYRLYIRMGVTHDGRLLPSLCFEDPFAEVTDVNQLKRDFEINKHYLKKKISQRKLDNRLDDRFGSHTLISSHI